MEKKVVLTLEEVDGRRRRRRKKKGKQVLSESVGECKAPCVRDKWPLGITGHILTLISAT